MLAAHYAILSAQIYLIAFHFLRIDKKRNVLGFNATVVAGLALFDVLRYLRMGAHVTQRHDTLVYLVLIVGMGIYATKSFENVFVFVAIELFHNLIAMMGALVFFNFFSIYVEVALQSYLWSLAGLSVNFFTVGVLVFLTRGRRFRVEVGLISKKEWLLLTLNFFIFGFYLLHFLSVRDHAQSQWARWLSSLGLVGGMLGLLGLIGYVLKNTEMRHLKDRFRLQEAVIKHQLSHYEQIKLREKKTSRFRHDIQKHMFAVRNALENQQNEKALTHVLALIEDFEAIRDQAGVDTGADVLSANLYHFMSKYPNIRVDWEGKFPKHLRLSDQDVVALFANLLENAFEAADKVENDPFIVAKVQLINGMLFFGIKNTYVPNPTQNGVEFKTTKRDKKHHGLGLSIVKDVAEKYNGEVKITAGKRVFLVEVTVPL